MGRRVLQESRGINGEAGRVRGREGRGGKRGRRGHKGHGETGQWIRKGMEDQANDERASEFARKGKGDADLMIQRVSEGE
eukprot:6171882-Pleurochrysis_carterae.AAC.1